MIKHNLITREQKQAGLILLLSFIVSFMIIVLSNHFGVLLPGFRLEGFETGKAAPRDLVADRYFLFTDKKATEDLVQEQLHKAFPVFEFDNDMTNTLLNNLLLFSQKYLFYKETRDPELRSEIITDTIDEFTLDEINFLLDDVDPYVIIPASTDLIEELLNDGIVRLPENFEEFPNKNIQIWRWKNGRKEFNVFNTDSLHTRASIAKIIPERLILKSIQDSDKFAVQLLVDNFVAENIFFDEIQTELKYDKIRNETKPVLEEINPGDLIIRNGFMITEIELQKAMELYSEIKKIDISRVIAVFLFLILIFIFSCLLFIPLFKKNRRRYQYAYLLISFYLVFIISTTVILQFNFSGDFLLALFLPTALLSIIISLLIGLHESIIAVFVFSVSLFMFPSPDIYIFIFSMVSGVSGAYLMQRAKKRLDMAKSAAFLSLINILTIVIIGLLLNSEPGWYPPAIFFATFSAIISSMINLAVVPVFEHFLNIPTVFRLIELSDMNSPLFRKMITLAPGTYGHSVSVANLAESACREIRANPILARVGAYYHDLGKMDQPEYFIENQTEGNKHDFLNPSLSVAVIKSHVKVGIEKAKEMGLPFEVIDIIAQHHGSGLVGFFYTEAVKKEGAQSKVKPEDYSYTGIPPESKEAAVVMLADTVEAATRVLKKPTINKLDKFIWKLIMDKIEKGQLINTDLTMNDLLVIKKSFLQILSGHFHTRIEYPKLKGMSK